MAEETETHKEPAGRARQFHSRVRVHKPRVLLSTGTQSHHLHRSHLSISAIGGNYISKDLFHFIWLSVFLKLACILRFDKHPSNRKYEPTAKAIAKSWGFVHYQNPKEETHFLKEADLTFHYLSSSVSPSPVLGGRAGALSWCQGKGSRSPRPPTHGVHSIAQLIIWKDKVWIFNSSVNFTSMRGKKGRKYFYLSIF